MRDEDLRGPGADLEASGQTSRRGGARPEKRRRAPLLASRRFLPLFLVQALGAFNDNVFRWAFVGLATYQIMAGVDAYEILPGLWLDRPALGAVAGGLFILPFALLAPMAGQLSDRMDKAQMMRWVKFAEIIIMMCGVVALQMGSIALLYLVLFLMGAQSAFFSPIKYGVLPRYLNRAELVAGNGFIQAATFFAILLGTLIGQFLVLRELGWAFGIPLGGVELVCVSIVAVAIIGWVASLFAPPAPPIGPLPKVDWMLFGAMSEVFSAARAEPVAFRTIFAISWFWFVGATFMALLPAFTVDELRADESVSNLLLGAFSVGVAIGSMVCGLIYGGRVRVGYAPWGAVGIGVFSIVIFATARAMPPAGEMLMNVSDLLSSTSGWLLVLSFIGLAACAGLYVTPLNAVYQRAAPEQSRGRVVACSNMIDALAMALSSVTAVVLSASLGLDIAEIYGLVGGTGLIAAAFVARWAPETRLGSAALSIWPIRPDA